MPFKKKDDRNNYPILSKKPTNKLKEILESMKPIFALLLLLLAGCSTSPFHQARDSYLSNPGTNEELRGWVHAEMPEEEWSKLETLPKSKRFQEECVASLKSRMPRDADVDKVKYEFKKCMNKLNWKLVSTIPKVIPEVIAKVPVVTEDTAKVAPTVKEAAQVIAPIDMGVWFEAESTGKLYKDYDKAGKISRVRIDGHWFSKDSISND